MENEPAVEELELDPTLAHFITIRMDCEGDVEIDLGDFNHFEARGILGYVYRKMKKQDPDLVIRHNGKSLIDELFDDEEEEDEDEESL